MNEQRICSNSFDYKEYDFVKTATFTPGYQALGWKDFGVEGHIILLFYYTLSCFPPEERQNLLVLDVGANAGYYTLLSASLGYQVEYVEPQISCVNLIQENIELNPTWKNLVFPNNNGVASENYYFSMPNVPACDTGLQTILTKNKDSPEALDSGTIQISTITLDELIEKHGSPIVPFLKCDTEGAEIGAIIGARNAFSKGLIHNFIVEIAPHVWSNSQISLGKGIRTLKELQLVFGYEAILLEDNELTPFNQYRIPSGDFPDFGEYYRIPADEIRRLIHDRYSKKRAMNIWYRNIRVSKFYQSRT